MDRNALFFFLVHFLVLLALNPLNSLLCTVRSLPATIVKAGIRQRRARVGDGEARHTQGVPRAMAWGSAPALAVTPLAGLVR